MNAYVGIDIGGSHLGLSIFDDYNELLASYEEPLNPSTSPDQMINRFIAILEDLKAQVAETIVIVAAGMGCPGQCKDGVLVAASNFPEWKNVPLATMLSSALNNMPVTLVNDADAAIAAEVWGTDCYGDIKHAAMLTLGTGIGLGLIINGKLHSGANGLIEGGHAIVHPTSTGRACGCGQSGCIEAHASARSVALLMAEASNGKTGELSFDPESEGAKGVFSRAAAGEQIAQSIVRQVTDDLATFCVSLCRVVDPQVIIFGGGMSLAGEALLGPLRDALKRRTWTVLPTDVQLVTAKQAGQGGILGAALAAKNLFETTHPIAALVHKTSRIESASSPESNGDGGGRSICGEVVGNVLAGALSAGIATSLYYALMRSSHSCSSVSGTGGRIGLGCYHGRYAFLIGHVLVVGLQILSLSAILKRK